MKSSLSKAQGAFTLMEMLVTVTIVVISLVIGFVNYLQFLDKQKLYQVGLNIEGMLKDARLKAQSGFLGSQEIGFCTQLAAVEVLSGTTADNKINVAIRIRCDNNSLFTYENYIVDQEEVVLDKNFQMSFFPLRGSTVLLNNASVASGSAILSRGGHKVTFNLDQGGTIDVKYE